MNKVRGRFLTSFISLLLVFMLMLPVGGSLLGTEDGCSTVISSQCVEVTYPFCLCEDEASISVGDQPVVMTDYSEGNGTITYSWTYDHDDYSVSFDLSYERYSYYADYEIERFMSVPSDRDNALNFITVDDSVIVYLAEGLDDLGEQADKNEAELAGLVLTFVQTLPYATDLETHSTTDYWSFPVETLYEGTGDCEDMSFLYSTIMAALGYETALLIFDDHVAVGINCTGLDGWYYAVDGVRYYYCETTGLGWDIGEMPEEYDEAYVLEVGTELGAPVDLSAEANDGSVTLTWSPPNSDGGAAIDYYVIYQDGEQVAITTNTVSVITELENGVEYEFTVAAHNADGMGPVSSPVVIAPVGVGDLPGTPTDLEVVNGDGSATLSWIAPAYEGVTDIDYYVVYQDGVQVTKVNGTTVTIEDLDNGNVYLFTVAAHNSAGLGPKTSFVVAEPAIENYGFMDWAIPIILLLSVLVIAIVVVLVSNKRRAERAALIQRTQQYPPYPPIGTNALPPQYGPGQEPTQQIDDEAGPFVTPPSSSVDAPVVADERTEQTFEAEARIEEPPAPAVAAPVATGTVQAPKFCMNCGSPLSGEGSFCSNCGSRVR